MVLFYVRVKWNRCAQTRYCSNFLLIRGRMMEGRRKRACVCVSEKLEMELNDCEMYFKKLLL